MRGMGVGKGFGFVDVLEGWVWVEGEKEGVEGRLEGWVWERGSVRGRSVSAFCQNFHVSSGSARASNTHEWRNARLSSTAIYQG